MELIRDALAQPGVRRRFLLEWSELAGWGGGYRRANARLSQWLSGEGAYRFPLVALPTLVKATGNASFLDPLLALWWQEAVLIFALHQFVDGGGRIGWIAHGELRRPVCTARPNGRLWINLKTILNK